MEPYRHVGTWVGDTDRRRAADEGMYPVVELNAVLRRLVVDMPMRRYIDESRVDHCSRLNNVKQVKEWDREPTFETPHSPRKSVTLPSC